MLSDHHLTARSRTLRTAPGGRDRRGSAFWGVLISLCFWLTLLVATALYGAVVLAPKLVSTRSLSRHVEQQQLNLLALERKTEQLEQVVIALDQDPEFASEIARLELSIQRPGEEVLPVETGLQLAPMSPALPELPATPAAESWGQPALLRIAADDQLRQMLLGVAAGLVILAFTFLQERSPEDDSGPSSPLTRWQRLTTRYRTLRG